MNPAIVPIDNYPVIRPQPGGGSKLHPKCPCGGTGQSSCNCQGSGNSHDHTILPVDQTTAYDGQLNGRNYSIIVNPRVGPRNGYSRFELSINILNTKYNALPTGIKNMVTGYLNRGQHVVIDIENPHDNRRVDDTFSMNYYKLAVIAAVAGIFIYSRMKK